MVLSADTAWCCHVTGTMKTNNVCTSLCSLHSSLAFRPSSDQSNYFVFYWCWGGGGKAQGGDGWAEILGGTLKTGLWKMYPNGRGPLCSGVHLGLWFSNHESWEEEGLQEEGRGRVQGQMWAGGSDECLVRKGGDRADVQPPSGHPAFQKTPPGRPRLTAPPEVHWRGWQAVGDEWAPASPPFLFSLCVCAQGSVIPHVSRGLLLMDEPECDCLLLHTPVSAKPPGRTLQPQRSL